MTVFSADPRMWPTKWADVLRDRLRFLRLLCLILTLLTLAGVTLTLVILAPSSSLERQATTVAGAVLLGGLWVYGFRRGGVPALLIPPEVILLLVITSGVQHMFAAFGIMYTALQFRATFGTRRQATLVAFVYAGTLVTGHALVGGEAGALRPIVLVELMAGAFNAYAMHTLTEVLSRDKKRADELRHSQDRYRALFHNNPYPMWEVDPRTLRFTDSNAAASALYGYTRDEFLAMTVLDLRAPEDRAAFGKVIPAFGGDQPLSLNARHRRKDGGSIEVEITTQVFDFGNRKARVGIARDITERQQVERALRESEQRFRSVAENLREAVMITDTDDRIVFASSRVREVLGYEPEEVTGRIAAELLLEPVERNVFGERLRDRLQGNSEVYEADLRHKDGRRISAQISASPYRDPSGRIIGTLGAISDITELKRLEARLHQAMRMEAVGQLAGGVAHDFNNLLTVIKCHTELMLGEATANDPARENITEIVRAADRGATLTQQLLAFSRKQLLRPRRVGLAEVVLDAEPMLRRGLGARVELRTTSDGSAADVYADPMQLEQVLATLVANANDAMPNGGRITIDTRVSLLKDDDAATIRELPTGRYAMLTVSDTGAGMSGEVVQRLFEPFFTTKDVGEGTGLGLASLYGIVRQSGGFVDVQSTPGVGTTFRIYLPMSGDPELTGRPSREALQSAE